VSEADLKRAVIAALSRLRGVHVLRLNAGITVLGTGQKRRAIVGCEPGTPDVLVMLPDQRVMWLELKTDKGRVSKVQAAWHAMARSLGHTVEVVRTVEDAVRAVTYRPVRLIDHSRRIL
jgi:hypothetical protein